MAQIFSWKRFWIQRDQVLNFDGSGYVADPDDNRLYNPNLVTFEDIAHHRCLILLGEPGIGKTTALKAEESEIRETVEQSGGRVMEVDLASVGSDYWLQRELLEGSELLDWSRSNYELHLFLDNFDLCRARLPTLPLILANELKRLPTDRLHIRIACRTADFPIDFDKTIAAPEMWGKDDIGVYELAPLRLRDVEQAATDAALDAHAFLQEVSRTRAGALAAKPITLRFLLEHFRKDGALPVRQADVYEIGCRHLCEETNLARQQSAAIGAHAANERLTAARYLAAMTVLSDIDAVYLPDAGDVPHGQVRLGDLCYALGGTDVTRDLLKETIGTGLFAARGVVGSMGWAHRTYAEYLAARFLADSGMPWVQIRSLLLSPDGSVIPQLEETAAWLAGMRRDTFDYLLNASPDVLLRSDVACADLVDKEALVGGLLQRYADGVYTDRGHQVRHHFWKLKSPALAGVLRPYIAGPSVPEKARYVAIDIAEECREEGVVNELVHLVVDEAAPLHLRVNAAGAVARYGPIDARAQLRPLLDSGLSFDEDDDLKGNLLRACWPELLTAEALFGYLTPARNGSYYGAYTGFEFEAAEHLQTADLPIALGWVADNAVEDHVLEPFARLKADILQRGFAAIDDPSTCRALATAVLKRLRVNLDMTLADDDHPLRNPDKADTDKRRKLIQELVLHADPASNDLVWLVDLPAALVLRRDFSWLVDQMVRDHQVRPNWVELVRYSYVSPDATMYEVLTCAVEANPELRQHFISLLGPIPLDSDMAAEMRHRENLWKDHEERFPPPPLLDPPPLERALHQLTQIEEGKVHLWTDLTVQMVLGAQEDVRWQDRWQNPDLSQSPVWVQMEDKDRQLVIKAAHLFLRRADDRYREWVGKFPSHCTAYAGYKALFLLYKEDQIGFSALDAEVWGRWMHICIDYPHFLTAGKDDEVSKAIIATAFQRAPAAFAAAVRTLLSAAAAEGQGFRVLQRVECDWRNEVEGIWSAELEHVYLDTVSDQPTVPDDVFHLLRLLLNARSQQAVETAHRLLETETESEERKSAALRALIEFAPKPLWTQVYERLRKDEEFAESVLLQIARDFQFYSFRILGRLEAKGTGELFLLLTAHFPYAEDDRIAEAHWVGPREDAQHWRDSLLKELEEAGTPEAVAELRRISEARPDLGWMVRVIRRAEALCRERSWVPPHPREIIKLLEDRNRRFVADGNQLLEVIVESLSRMEASLFAETPVVKRLWNETPYRMPKNEETLSDEIKRHLEEDLRSRWIIANREVVIANRSSEQGDPGQRTDIHIDAVPESGGRHDPIKAVIEVKGCWNTDLKTAMQAQLVDRYLQASDCHHGIYVVGWFKCDAWDGEQDPRKAATPKILLDEARTAFNQQAASLSAGGINVRAFVMDTALR